MASGGGRQPEAAATSYYDNDVVAYKDSSGNRYEVFLVKKGENVLRKIRKNVENGGNSIKDALLALCADKVVYRDSKKGKIASKEYLKKEFCTDDVEEIIQKILVEGKIKIRVYQKDPIVEFILDFIFFTEVVTGFYTFYNKDVLFQFGLVCALIFVVIIVTMAASRSFGRWMSKTVLAAAPFNDPLRGSTALRQFESQVWQLVIHVTMSSLAIYAYTQTEDFLNKPYRFIQLKYLLEGLVDEVELVYRLQLGIWFVTLVWHRFIDVRSGDYHVMYSHHVITIAVVLISYAYERYAYYGLVVFLLHDISDVPLDIMKLLNLLRIENKGGWYGAEIAYCTLMPIWAYCRLYLFPSRIIVGGVMGTIYGNKKIDGEYHWCHGMKTEYKVELFRQGKSHIWEDAFSTDCHCCGALTCLGLLTGLLFLHIWWTYLLLRIGYRAVFLNEDTHAVSNEMYFEDQTEAGTENITEMKDSKKNQ